MNTDPNATLDALIAELEKGSSAPEAAPSEVQQAAIARHRRDAAMADQQHEQNVLKQAQPTAEEMQQRNEEVLAQAVRRFKDGALANESDALVEGYLLATARRDPRFSAAVPSGEPRRVNAALAEARREYFAELRKGSVETDHHRARASVRNSAHEEPPEFDARKVARMSEAEYDAYIAARTGVQAARHPNVWTGSARELAVRPWDRHNRGGGPRSDAPAGPVPPMIGRR